MHCFVAKIQDTIFHLTTDKQKRLSDYYAYFPCTQLKANLLAVDADCNQYICGEMENDFVCEIFNRQKPL